MHMDFDAGRESQMKEFSRRQHAVFLSGYLDAVARSITTNAMLFNLSVTFLEPGDSLGLPDCVDVIDNWSMEFGAFADGFLGVDQRSRLGFYLVDYICWLRDYTAGAECRKSAGDAPVHSVIYRVTWPDGGRVVIAAERHSRPTTEDSSKPNPLRGSTGSG